MSVDRRLTAFFDAAVEQYLLSTGDRVLGELTVRRAGLSGETNAQTNQSARLPSRAITTVLIGRDMGSDGFTC